MSENPSPVLPDNDAADVGRSSTHAKVGFGSHGVLGFFVLRSCWMLADWQKTANNFFIQVSRAQSWIARKTGLLEGGNAAYWGD